MDQIEYRGISGPVDPEPEDLPPNPGDRCPCCHSEDAQFLHEVPPPPPGAKLAVARWWWLCPACHGFAESHDSDRLAAQLADPDLTSEEIAAIVQMLSVSVVRSVLPD